MTAILIRTKNPPHIAPIRNSSAIGSSLGVVGFVLFDEVSDVTRNSANGGILRERYPAVVYALKPIGTKGACEIIYTKKCYQ